MRNIQLALRQWRLCFKYPKGNSAFWMVINRNQQEISYGVKNVNAFYEILFSIRY